MKKAEKNFGAFETAKHLFDVIFKNKIIDKTNLKKNIKDPTYGFL